MIRTLEAPNGLSIEYLGADHKEGAKPAFFYFALSARESLELHPYSQPPLLASDPGLRVFSFTIPGHGNGLNKFDAMHYWAEKMSQGEYLLETFFDKVEVAIRWLIDEKIVDKDRIAVGGLSRGGFVATHIAARIKEVQTILGFAPLTDLMQLKEFTESDFLRKRADELKLVHLVDRLVHVHNVRFYIGNLDHRVGTDACYDFIKKLAEKGHEVHARHQKVELMITQAIGHKGHGTAPHTFEEGSLWTKRILLKT